MSQEQTNNLEPNSEATRNEPNSHQQSTHVPPVLPQIKEKPKLDEIRLVKQTDGNWKGYMHLNGKDLEVRDIDPHSCLMRLLTHP
jgi:hypothetical protein